MIATDLSASQIDNKVFLAIGKSTDQVDVITLNKTLNRILFFLFTSPKITILSMRLPRIILKYLYINCTSQKIISIEIKIIFIVLYTEANRLLYEHWSVINL